MVQTVVRICFSFARGHELRYLSHLDLLRFFQRALRRARLPVDYSRGFNPRVRLSLAVPLPVGVTAADEYADLYLREKVSPAHFLELLQRQLPVGLAVTGAGLVAPGNLSLAARIDAAVYHAVALEPEDSRCVPFSKRGFWEKAVQALLARENIIVSRHGCRDSRGRDIRPFILALAVSALPLFQEGVIPIPGDSQKASIPSVMFTLRAGSTGGVSPFIVLEKLAGAAGFGHTPPSWTVHREGLYISAGDDFKTPPQAGGVRFWTKKLL